MSPRLTKLLRRVGLCPFTVRQLGAQGRGELLSPATAAVCSGSGSRGDKVSLVIKRFCCLPAGSELGRRSALPCVKGVGCLKEIKKGTLNGLGPGVRGLKRNSSGSRWREKVV